jgi:hypothetical protein
MSKSAPLKLTEAERATIVNALTLAARQYEIDAERASELALHGMTIFEPAEALAQQFRQHSTDARELRDKITFCGSTFNFEHGGASVSSAAPLSATLGH